MKSFNVKIAGYLGIGVALSAIVLFSANSRAQDAATDNDSTTVNVSQNQTTIVVVPTPKPEEPADAVVFYITDDRQKAKAGDILTYRIVVRNQRDRDIDQVRIHVIIPDYLVPTATSPSAEANPQARTLTWSNLTLGDRAEQTYAFRAQVAPDAPHDYNLRTVAEINGPGVRGSHTDVTAVESKQFIVSEQAATTVAPAPVTQQPATPTPRPVTPTAPTGPTAGVILAIISLAGGTISARAVFRNR